MSPDVPSDEPITPEQSERVRRELARLGTDDASAPAIPPAVSARVLAALRAAPPAHAERGPRLRRLQLAGAVLGLCAVAAGIGVGVAMLTRDSSSGASGPAAELTAERITVTPTVPLPPTQIAALLTRPPDYGPLADPQACLAGLETVGTTRVLGAQPVDMRGRPGVLMVLPGDTSQHVVAIVVAPNCGADDSELLASTVLRRP
ncbi:hypothetical protein [Mycobacterium hubeiense]|uniref:hypothetical protein n=1 Tax=Mycobacterium hubeiense TaxID=1867256 RepID=UPI0018EA8CE9|nr:hypothetical protein [Mycobacterium sp. QGD 101]